MDGYERVHYTQKNSAFQISVYPKIFVHSLIFLSFSLSDHYIRGLSASVRKLEVVLGCIRKDLEIIRLVSLGGAGWGYMCATAHFPAGSNCSMFESKMQNCKIWVFCIIL